MSRSKKAHEKAPWLLCGKTRKETVNRDFDGYGWEGRCIQRRILDREHEQEIREALNEISGSGHTKRENVYGEV